MPYIVDLPARSPFFPKGLRAVDPIPEEIFQVVQVGDEWLASIVKSGTPMDPDLVPPRFAVDLKAEALPEFFGLPIGYAVSNRFREKVEVLEPKVHQFFPLDLTVKGGEVLTKDYWLLNICNRVDATDLQKTTLPLNPNGPIYSPRYYKVGEPIGLVLRKEAVAEKCMWVDRRFIDFFLSDELFEFVEENKLTKFRSTKIEAV